MNSNTIAKLIIVIMAGLISCKPDNKVSNNERIGIWPDTSTSVISTLFKQKAIEYADSVNGLLSEDQLPAFLYDVNLDYLDTFLLTNGVYNDREVFSLRIEIFKYITDTNALNRIIRDSYFKTQFDSTETYRKKGRFDAINNHVLAVLRKWEIATKSDTLSVYQSIY